MITTHRDRKSSTMMIEKDPKTYLDFLEIGTSDFDTLIQSVKHESNGMSVDPVAYYLTVLPSRPGWKKVNAAISDAGGVSLIYYIDPVDIEKYQLPNWVRGCSAIDRPHETVLKLLQSMGLDPSLIKSKEVVKWTLMELMCFHSVNGINLLKIDTEGHDVRILEKFLDDAVPEMLPQKIIFETNILSNAKDIHRVLVRLILAGYDVIECRTGGADTNTVLSLNPARMLGRNMFSSSRVGYYLGGYPVGYDPLKPPHGNTLAEAKAFCHSEGAGGVTLQYGRYEVRREAKLICSASRAETTSWVFLPSRVSKELAED